MKITSFHSTFPHLKPEQLNSSFNSQAMFTPQEEMTTFWSMHPTCTSHMASTLVCAVLYHLLLFELRDCVCVFFTLRFSHTCRLDILWGSLWDIPWNQTPRTVYKQGKCALKATSYRDFLGGPVVKTLWSQCRDMGSIPGRGIKIMQVTKW